MAGDTRLPLYVGLAYWLSSCVKKSACFCVSDSCESSVSSIKTQLFMAPRLCYQTWWSKPNNTLHNLWGFTRFGSGASDDIFCRAVSRNIEYRRGQKTLDPRFKNADWAQLQGKWLDHLRYFDRITGGRSSEGNRVTLLVGDEILPSILNAITTATHRVWIETYIFDSSKVAERFIEAMLDAKRRGVDVVLIVDWLGGFDMPSRWLKQLRDAEISAVVFNNWRNMGFRDHRKLAIIDHVGFCGSANISADAASEVFGGNGRFFDVHVKVEGPAVKHISELFCETLQSGNPGFHRSSFTPPPLQLHPDEEGAFVQVLESNASRQRRSVQTAYNRVISTASLSISATAGYFAPPALLYRSLKTAVRRRIPITLLLSGNSDVWGDVYAASYGAAKLQKAAAAAKQSPSSSVFSAVSSRPHSQLLRVWFSQSQHCHAKTLVIDGLWTAIGSFNLDRHSGRRNMEAVVAVMDAPLAEQVELLHNALASNNGLQRVPPMTAASSQQELADPACKMPSWDVPTTLEMSLSDWANTSVAQRFFMRIAYWLMQTSASPMFDCFDDVDASAEEERREQKRRAWKNRAQVFFSFGPSAYSLDMCLCCVN